MRGNQDIIALEYLVYSSSDLFFFLTEQAKSNVGAGVTGKIPQNKVYFFKAFNMDDKTVQLGLGFFLTVARKHADEQNKSQVLREFIFAFTLLSRELYAIPIESWVSRLPLNAIPRRKETSKCSFCYMQHKNTLIILFVCFFLCNRMNLKT